MEAAMAIFSARGFDGTTIEAVADALGYTKPALYYYFRNKEELMKDLVLDSLAEATEKICEISSSDASCVERLRAIIRYSMDVSLAHRNFFTMYHQMADFHDRVLTGEDRAKYEELAAAIPRHIIGIIAEGVESGIFRREKPEVLGGLLFGMISGILMHLEMNVLAGEDRERLVDTVCEIVIKGITP